MNKKLVKAEISLAITFFCILFCAIAFFSFGDSTAWFSKNKVVRADGLNMSVATPGDLSVGIEVFEIAGKVGDNLYFNKKNINEQGVKIYMPQYQLLNEANRYLLMRMYVTGTTEENLMLTVNTDTTYFMDADHPLIGDDGIDENKDYQNCLSSIIAFAQTTKPDTQTVSIGVSNSAHGTAITNQEVYMVNRSVLDFKKFANEDADGTMIISPTIELQDGFTLTNETKEDETVVQSCELYIIVAYDDININKVYSANIGNNITVGTNGIIFVADMYFGLKIKETTT